MIKKILFIFSFVTPWFAFSATAPTSVAGFINIIICLALDLVPIIVLLAFAEFIRGLIKYVSSGDNEEKRSEGINFMVYGMIGFFVIVGFWGALRIGTSTFNVSFGIPQFKSSGASPINTSSCSSIF